MTKVRPPTAATFGWTKRRMSWRTAPLSTTTSESTETMISASTAARTPRLMPLRLPMFSGLLITRTLGCPSAALFAQATLSSREQSSTTMISSSSRG
ncbi:hypothetical protein COSO111634_38485 [Corallococcus soli]